MVCRMEKTTRQEYAKWVQKWIRENLPDSYYGLYISQHDAYWYAPIDAESISGGS